MSILKTLKTRTIGPYSLELGHWPDPDNEYVIYLYDWRINAIQSEKELGLFKNRIEAQNYLENLNLEKIEKMIESK